MQAHHHGSHFSGMYLERAVFELKDQVLHDVFFDSNHNFAGFKFKNEATKEHTHMTAMDDKYLSYVHNNDAMFDGFHKHMRIVGFRSTKACASSAQIMSVQPIYFASGDICAKQVLLPLTAGLMDEMPSYGPLCSTVSDSNVFASTAASGSGVDSAT